MERISSRCPESVSWFDLAVITSPNGLCTMQRNHMRGRKIHAASSIGGSYFGEIRNQLFFSERRLLSYLSRGVGRVAKRNMSHSKALCQTNTRISSDVVLEGILALYDEFSDFSSKLTAPQCRIDCRHRFHHNKLRTCSFSNLKVSGCSSGLGLLNKL